MDIAPGAAHIVAMVVEWEDTGVADHLPGMFPVVAGIPPGRADMAAVEAGMADNMAADSVVVVGSCQRPSSRRVLQG